MKRGETIKYRGWKIWYEKVPIPIHLDYHFAHENYDGAPIYADGPPGDTRCGSALSLEDAKAYIDEYEDEQDWQPDPEPPEDLPPSTPTDLF